MGLLRVAVATKGEPLPTRTSYPACSTSILDIEPPPGLLHILTHCPCSGVTISTTVVKRETRSETENAGFYRLHIQSCGKQTRKSYLKRAQAKAPMSTTQHVASTTSSRSKSKIAPRTQCFPIKAAIYHAASAGCCCFRCCATAGGCCCCCWYPFQRFIQ